MALGDLRGPPYQTVIGLLAWAENYWPFINGKALLMGCKLKKLEAPDFVDVLMEMNVQESMHEEEVVKHVEKRRSQLLQRARTTDFDYDSNESYGRSNDTFGPTSDEPLPYIAPTEQTEEGYLGLDAPMG